jgi:polyhydroxybutyrate depolymerase
LRAADCLGAVDATIPGVTLARRDIQINGTDRTYWVAPGARLAAPLIVVLHGLGITPAVMSSWTGLAERGPTAGFATVFPVALREAWDDGGLGRTNGEDDDAFIAAVVDEMVATGSARADRVFLVGLSNGAFFAEHLARCGAVRSKGIVLVAGSASEAGRARSIRPAQPSAVLMIVGTADRNVPYGVGHPSGLSGWLSRRRMRSILSRRIGREVVASEVVCSDWGVVNGCDAGPVQDNLGGRDGDLRVEKLTWSGRDAEPVVLYRLIEGGHGWPGGRQSPPRLLVGRISKAFDATGIALDFARGVT